MELTKEVLKERCEIIIKYQDEVEKFSADMAIMIRDFCKQNRISISAMMKKIDKWHEQFRFNFKNYDLIFEREIQSEPQNSSKENMTDKEAEKIFQYALESGLPISLVVDGYARNKKIWEEKK